MKKALSLTLVLLFAVVLASVCTSAASAAPGGVTRPPYWYTVIDSSGHFSNPTVDPDTQNSAQWTIFDVNNQEFMMTLHPNYYPSNDNQYTAQETTVIQDMQVYNPIREQYEDCLYDGLFIVPREYMQFTSAGLPYLQFNVIFVKYDNKTGNKAATYTYTPAYFDLRSVW
jgi:hypothetical protein